MGRLSLATWLYIAAVVSAAAAILARVPSHLRLSSHGFWVVCVALALLFLICDSTPTVLGDRQWAWSPSSAATLAAVVLLGSARAAFGAAMVGAIAVFSVRRHVPLVERLFNGAMYAIAGYAAGHDVRGAARRTCWFGLAVLADLAIRALWPTLHGISTSVPMCTHRRNLRRRCCRSRPRRSCTCW